MAIVDLSVLLFPTASEASDWSVEAFAIGTVSAGLSSPGVVDSLLPLVVGWFGCAPENPNLDSNHSSDSHSKLRDTSECS